MFSVNWQKMALVIGSIGFFLAILLFLAWLFLPSVEYSEAKSRWNAAVEVRQLAQDGFVEAGNRLAQAQQEESKALKELMLIRK
jgi:hypothetical protein